MQRWWMVTLTYRALLQGGAILEKFLLERRTSMAELWVLAVSHLARARGDVKESERASISAPGAQVAALKWRKKLVVDMQAQEGWGALPFIADGASGLSKRLLLLAPNFLCNHHRCHPEEVPLNGSWKLGQQDITSRPCSGAPGHSNVPCFFLEMLQRCTFPQVVLSDPLSWKATPRASGCRNTPTFIPPNQQGMPYPLHSIC